jgi:cytochrome oxidase Cu insertion factor (SCO1/SenC/PrrC family)
MPRWMIPVLVFAATGFVLSVVGLVVLSGRREAINARVLAPDPLCEGLVIPAFSLIDHDGRPVDQSLFDGRITIVDFIFTNCPFVCPGMTMRMSELCKELGPQGVRFVSMSVDPERDTPERLREFASFHDADLRWWRFLTGPGGAVSRIVRDSLQFELSPDPNTPIPLRDGTTMSNITHPKKLLLIGPDRGVLALCDPDRQDEVDAVKTKARLAARLIASGAARPPSPPLQPAPPSSGSSK